MHGNPAKVAPGKKAPINGLYHCSNNSRCSIEVMQDSAQYSVYVVENPY